MSAWPASRGSRICTATTHSHRLEPYCNRPATEEKCAQSASMQPTRRSTQSQGDSPLREGQERQHLGLQARSQQKPREVGRTLNASAMGSKAARSRWRAMCTTLRSLSAVMAPWPISNRASLPDSPAHTEHTRQRRQ